MSTPRLSRDERIMLMYVRGSLVSDIAEEMSLTPSRVYQVLRDNGVATHRSDQNAEMYRDEVISAWHNGATHDQLMSRFSLTRPQVQFLLGGEGHRVDWGEKRRCSRCKKWKVREEEFHRGQQRGFQPICKPCNRKRAKDWYEQHKETK